MLQQLTDILAMFVDPDAFGEMRKKRLPALFFVKGNASIWRVIQQRLHGIGREEKSVAWNQEDSLIKGFE
tara:strand:- start:214 stop:423 length:210 start_codon:yes stop_codon:yes gene_type:complete